MDIYDKLSTVPARSGVYLFKDEKNRVLYVGKAKDLRPRLKSYFQKASALDARKSAMIRSVRDFEYTVTVNELEAFILEANLIKQYRPRYNVLLRDDKSYPYLKLTVNEKWPRLEVVRRIRKDGERYYGPYVPSGAMWELVSFIRENVPIRTCRYPLDRPMRPCIRHQIKKCLAPCAGLADPEEYLSMVNEIRMVLEGKNRKVIASLDQKMQQYSDTLEFEKAARVRDRIIAIRKISESQNIIAPELCDIDLDAVGIWQEGSDTVCKVLFVRKGIMLGSKHFHMQDRAGETEGYLLKSFLGQFYRKEIIPPAEVLCSLEPEDSDILATWLTGRRGAAVKISVPQRGIRKRLIEMAVENARILAGTHEHSDSREVLREIASLLGLSEAPEDIGAFDISNISGAEPVGAYVYWADGHFNKARYRHVRMEAIQGPNDYAMMREMVRRMLVSFDRRLPDLVIIDGGQAHLEAAVRVIKESGLQGQEVISIAKGPDRVFFADRRPSLDLQDGSAASLLLKRIRDEVHRFGITFHRKLRTKRTFESPLEKIPGIGRLRRLALLRHFGSIEGIRHATAEEIAGLKGFHLKLAQQVLNLLNKKGKE